FTEIRRDAPSMSAAVFEWMTGTRWRREPRGGQIVLQMCRLAFPVGRFAECRAPGPHARGGFPGLCIRSSREGLHLRYVQILSSAQPGYRWPAPFLETSR